MSIVEFHIDDFLKSFEAMQDKMDNNGMIAFRDAVRRACEAQKEHGYQNKTGRLTASMQWKTDQRAPFAWRGEVVTSAPYALYVNEPTRPHKIVARRAEVLKFYWPKVGRWVSFKSVNHPGTKAAGFTAAAVQTFGQSAPLEIERAFDAAVK